MAGETVSCKAVGAAVTVAKAAGLDVPELLAAHRISARELADPDARFPHATWIALWRAIDARGPGAYGLRAARGLPEHHFDVIEYIMRASDDLGHALEQFARYFALLSTGVNHVFVRDEAGGRLERRYPPGAHTTIGHPAEFAFACVVLRARRLTDADWRPREVRFAHRRPAEDREHREVFDCPLVWDSEPSLIAFDAGTLALPMRRPEPFLRRVLERHADALVASLPTATTDLRARTKEAIVAGIRSNKAAVVDVAKALGMSERTLQRRLGELDTTFAKLLDEARSELALRYLAEPSIAIAEVAFLLGFADATAFHRAFRRWTDRTPAEHRRAALAGQA